MSRPLHLTFDDGPDPLWTPRVLDVLAAHGATATFFVLGRAVRRAPRMLEAILDGGHAIGLHGEAHLDHTKATPEDVARDTAAALDVLHGHGVAPDLWRLPWGRHGATTGAIAQRHGLRIVGWDADTHDWRGDGWDDQPEDVRGVARHGGVVLLHDGFGPGATRTSCANTLALVDAFLEIADAEGLTAASIEPAERCRA
ncbi:MAG: polysaccharide deacetylase family protein [Patulibacter minatonensis]